MRIFTFSYQALTRYLRNNCGSEQEVHQDPDERWLYQNMGEYLHKKQGSTYMFHWDEFAPEELNPRSTGAPRRIDLIATSLRGQDQETVRVMYEAKLMIDPKRAWAKEIFSDILRVASIRKKVGRMTRRFVLVVGQERCWEKLDTQLGGLIPSLCPMKKGLINRKRATTLSPSWMESHEGAIEDYLRDVMPKQIKVRLAGCSLSNRGPNEMPGLGISARLWQIYPSF